MFNSSLTLDDASGDDVTYALIGQDLSSSRRIDTATTAALPGLLQIKHSSQGNGGGAIDRHLVQVIRTVDGTGGPKQVVVNFTIAVPRDPAATNAIVADAVSNLLDFIASGGIATLTTDNLFSLLRGES